MLNIPDNFNQNFGWNLKLSLFQAMYLAGNELVIQLFTNFLNQNKQLSPGKTQKVNHLIRWDNFLKLEDQKKQDLLKSKVFKAVCIENFHKILSDEEITYIIEAKIFKQETQKTPIDSFPHDPNQHQGMHVEAKGVAYLASSGSREFNIGLATKFNDTIGCCGACVVEFGILSDYKYIINRTADFPENFPPATNYSPSLLIMNGTYLYPIFIKKLIEACKAVTDHSNSNDFKLNTQNLLTSLETLKLASPIEDAILISILGEYKAGKVTISCEKNNLSGQGFNNENDKNYWHTYSKVAMDELLQLRLKSAGIDEDIEIFSPNYVFDNSSTSVLRLAKDIIAKNGDKLLVNLNLYGKHWVGIVIDKTANEINIHYMDPEQRAIPVLLKKMLSEALGMTNPEQQINFMETELEPQKYSNCGPEVIENFMQHLTGKRLSQEDAVPVHALLFEESIMLVGDFN